MTAFEELAVATISSRSVKVSEFDEDMLLPTLDPT
jgi:hypothetical protein